jgi:DNA-binding LacI/PurR family transcriptional regulator
LAAGHYRSASTKRFDAVVRRPVVTMKDVARAANVSLSTVSYALSGARPISAATRERIEQAMHDLGFTPNAMARGLASRRSHILALSLPWLENGLGGTQMEFVTSAAQTARSHGYHLVLWPFEPDDAEDIRTLAVQGLADGVIVMEVLLTDPRVAALEEAEVPFTMIGRTQAAADVRSVDIDFDQTTEDAVAHLVELGHRHIALLNHSQTSRDAGYGPTVRAATGFGRAMEVRGLTPVVEYCDESAAGGRAAVGRLLGQHAETTALVAMNEVATFGAVTELSALGRSIPEDFSVLSIVSSPGVGEMFNPPLTTMHAPGAELGRLGVEELLDLLRGTRTPDRPVLLTCTWTPGGSTAPPPTRTP